MTKELRLFSTTPKKIPAPIHIEIVKRSAYITGTGAWGLAEALGLARMRCPQRKMLMIPANRVDDFVAFIEHRTNRVVTVARQSAA